MWSIYSPKLSAYCRIENNKVNHVWCVTIFKKKKISLPTVGYFDRKYLRVPSNKKANSNWFENTVTLSGHITYIKICWLKAYFNEWEILVQTSRSMVIKFLFGSRNYLATWGGAIKYKYSEHVMCASMPGSGLGGVMLTSGYRNSG